MEEDKSVMGSAEYNCTTVLFFVSASSVLLKICTGTFRRTLSVLVDFRLRYQTETNSKRNIIKSRSKRR